MCVRVAWVVSERGIMGRIVKIAALVALVFISWSFLNQKNFDEGIIAYRDGDYETAYGIFINEAQSGNTEAQFNVAHMYKNALFVEQSNAQAITWYTMAAQSGHPIAQNDLGNMCKNGEGMDVDLDAAMTWFLKSSEQNYYGAQYNIGRMFYMGEGVDQDYEQALNWYLLAAAQGMTDAQRNLGVMYKLGQGTLQNDIYSYMWIYVAKSRGDRVASALLDEYNQQMNSTDIQEALNLANKWITGA